jgi:hypothetical protein
MRYFTTLFPLVVLFSSLIDTFKGRLHAYRQTFSVDMAIFAWLTQMTRIARNLFNLYMFF